MKNWTELENSSFFDANARERALGMVDKGTFTEFLNPLDRLLQPASAGTWDCCGI